METMQDATHRLHSLLHDYDWYADKVIQHPTLHNSMIAYVHRMDASVLTTIPNECEGYQVRVHFISSAPPETILTRTASEFTVPVVEDDAAYIDDKLWNLQRVCGKDNLMDIFFEYHDRDDAVTNQAANFPEVYAELGKLYDEYGFDVIIGAIEN